MPTGNAITLFVGDMMCVQYSYFFFAQVLTIHRPFFLRKFLNCIAEHRAGHGGRAIQ